MRWPPWKTGPPVLSAAEGYDRWAPSYAAEQNPVKNFSDQLVEEFLPDLNGKSVLDLGCGTGRICKDAESRGAVRIVGVDISPVMLEIAARQCPKAEFICQDISKVELPANTFDLVICSLVLGHLNTLNPTVKLMAATMRPGALLIITDFHPFQTSRGSRRTFRDQSSGDLFEIRHFPHAFDEYSRLLGDHGLRVVELLERKYAGAPVVFGLSAKKVE